MALLNIPLPVQAGLWTLATVMAAYIAAETLIEGASLTGDLYDESMVLGVGNVLFAMGAGLKVTAACHNVKNNDYRHHATLLALGAGLAFFAAARAMNLEMGGDPVDSVPHMLGLVVLLSLSAYMFWGARPLLKQAGVFLSKADENSTDRKNKADEELKSVC